MLEEATFDAIIQAITNLEPVTKACERAGATRGAFYYSIAKDPLRAVKYARALECKVEGYAEETVDIADTEQDAQKARNRIQARQWYAGKIAPKRFGERLDLTVTDALNPAALHAEGLKRARLMRDLNALPEQQGTDDALVIEHGATGNTSAPTLPAPGVPSIFD